MGKEDWSEEAFVYTDLRLGLVTGMLLGEVYIHASLSKPLHIAITSS